MSDTANEITIAAAIENGQFQDRCRFRFLIYAYTVMSEVTTCVANATVSPPATQIPVTNVTVGITAGMTLTDTFNLNAIPVNAVITGATGTSASTGTLSLNTAITGTITSGDILQITPVNHLARAAFASAIFRNTVDPRVLAMAILASTTNFNNCLANPSLPGGNILDADIDAQVALTFTGIALVGW